MIKKKIKKNDTRKRHGRLRVNLSGTSERPRLAVYRSNKHICVQIIDDVQGKTLVSAGTVEKEVIEKIKHGGNIDASKEVGKLAAERAKAKGIEQVVFDRGGNIYHGRVAAVADAARENGLDF